LAGEVACSRPPPGRFLTPGAGPWTRTTPRQYFRAAPLYMKSSSARKRAPAPVVGENLSCTDDVCCPSPRPPRRLPRRQWRRPQSSPIIISLAAQMADAEASGKYSVEAGKRLIRPEARIPAAACCWVPRLTLERLLHTKTPAPFALGTIKVMSLAACHPGLAATATPCFKPVCPLLYLSPDPAVAALSHER